MFYILLFMALGAGLYWLTHMRAVRGSQPRLGDQVTTLTEQLRQLREAQWEMRSAVDTLREEHEFTQRLAEPPEPPASGPPTHGHTA